MPTYALRLETGKDEAEDLAATLMMDGASGVEVRDGEGTPMPGVDRPPAGRAFLVAFYADLEACEAAREEHGGSLEQVPDEDWSETWKKDLKPMLAGRVFVRPSWITAAPPPGAVEVVLDPGMAFGTGSHPTTSLCLRALSDALPAAGGAAGVAVRQGAAVLDVGTGSGLLAIAARKLGATTVAGNDVDPVAVDVARENAAANGVSLGADFELRAEGLERLTGPYDVVVANILANTLVELAPEIAARLAPGGLLFLSGILAGQEGEVRDAYVARGLAARLDLDRAEGEWRLVALERADPRRPVPERRP
ncbi:MAG: 50S ribosomal protein L11 methyltransferase [Anaeromyxobacteraceae bacterium]